MYEELLLAAGLTKGEAAVYLSLLKLGTTTTGKIIEDAGISSGKIYEILEKLIKKGIVSYIVKGKTRYFQAADPSRIIFYLQEKQNQIKSVEEKIRKILPVLAEVQKGQPSREVTLYEGFRGIQTAIFEVLNKAKKDDVVLAMGITAKKQEQYNILWKKWNRLRAAKKIRCRALFSEGKTEYFKNFKKIPFTEVKIMEGVTPAALDVIGDNTLIFDYQEPAVCIVIKDANISKSFSMFFETLWSFGKVSP